MIKLGAKVSEFSRCGYRIRLISKAVILILWNSIISYILKAKYSMMKKIFFLMGLFIFTSSVAKAEINFAVSLDWLTVDADCIVKGRIISVKQSVTTPKNRTIKLVIIKKLKGGFGNVQDTIEVQNYPGYWEEDKYKNKVVLIFLKIAHENDKDVPYLLLGGGGLSNENALIDIENYGKGFTGDFRVLTSEQAIVDYIDDVIKKTKGLKKGNYIYIKAPYDSEAFKHLYAGSACYIAVPDNLYPNAKKKE